MTNDYYNTIETSSSAEFSDRGSKFLAYTYPITSVADFKEKLERYLYVAPIVVGFLFLVLTIYFIRYYLQTVHPYRQDLKNGMKELVYFIPEPYKTPFFETFYIRTISEQRPLVRISPELYQQVQPGSEAIMGIAPRSHFVFYIAVGNEVLEFDHRSASLDT